MLEIVYTWREIVRRALSSECLGIPHGYKRRFRESDLHILPMSFAVGGAVGAACAAMARARTVIVENILRTLKGA